MAMADRLVGTAWQVQAIPKVGGQEHDRCEQVLLALLVTNNHRHVAQRAAAGHHFLVRPLRSPVGAAESFGAAGFFGSAELAIPADDPTPSEVTTGGSSGPRPLSSHVSGTGDCPSLADGGLGCLRFLGDPSR